MSQNNGSNTSLRLKTGLAEMLKGGVIMDVTNAEQASIAEKAGAVAVMALERVPAQIRAEGGVARIASPKKIREIMAGVDIPPLAERPLRPLSRGARPDGPGGAFICAARSSPPPAGAELVGSATLPRPCTC